MPPISYTEGFGVAHGLGLVDFSVDWLFEGALSVRARPCIELYQETFHCYFSHLAEPDRTTPLVAHQTLSADVPPVPSTELLMALSTPLRPGLYDVLQATVTPRLRAHHGVRAARSASYVGCPDYGNDGFGLRLFEADHTSAVGYGARSRQRAPSELYLAEIAGARVVMLPLFGSGGLDEARVKTYQRGLARGACPTALLIGFYANDRCLFLTVLDGHHKLMAAAREGASVAVIAFVSETLLRRYMGHWCGLDEADLSRARGHFLGPPRAVCEAIVRWEDGRVVGGRGAAATGDRASSSGRVRWRGRRRQQVAGQ